MARTAAELAEHGGRLCVARALYPHAPEPWVDLSTGINPEAYPARPASVEARGRLPTLEEMRALEGVAGRAFGLGGDVGVGDGLDVGDAADRIAANGPSAAGVANAAADRIAAAGGSEALLRLMPYVLRADAAAVIGPTYSSHAAAWRQANVKVTALAPLVAFAPDTPTRDATTRHAAIREAAAPSALTPSSHPLGAATHSTSPLGSLARSAPAPGSVGTAPSKSALFANRLARHEGDSLDVAARVPQSLPARSVVTLVNPNNPDGTIIPRETLLESHDAIASRDGYLVVDEAFADIAPHCSVAAHAGTPRYHRLVVLRSFGKFYGLAGIRLGFIIAAPTIIKRVRELLGDWPISADAIAAGLSAYADDAWAHRTREQLTQSAHRLDALLLSSGLEITGGTSLFRLTRSNDARARFEQLLRAGILARPFDHDPTLLRFGLPHGEPAWQRLAAALRTP